MSKSHWKAGWISGAAGASLRFLSLAGGPSLFEMHGDLEVCLGDGDLPREPGVMACPANHVKACGDIALLGGAVGVEDTVLLETHQHDVQPGDVYLLCSDGLSDMLDDSTIAQILQSHESLETLCTSLIEAANDAGGKDNISVILVRVGGGTTAAPRSWWPFRR